MEKVPSENYSKEKYRNLLDRYSDSPHFFSDEVIARVDYLKKKYPDTHKYAFYHILGGSGIDEARFGPIEHEDFPGEDSVEDFLEGLIGEYSEISA